MNSMAAAMKRANLITDEDLAQAEAREKAERDAEAERKRVEQETRAAYEPLLANIGSLSGDMYRWMSETGKMIPLEVLEKWADLDSDREIMKEWAKWLAAYQESQKASA